MMIGCRAASSGDAVGTAVQATIPYTPALGKVWRRLSSNVEGSYVLRVVGYY